MDAVAIDFLTPNLGSGTFEQETCRAVLESAPVGIAKRRDDGWPVVYLSRGTESFLLDGPAHHGLIERLKSEQDCAVVLFGIGQGNTARSLLAAGVSVLAVFEPDPGLLRNFLETGPSDLRQIPIVTSLVDLDTIWSRTVVGRDNVHLADTTGYDAAFPAQRAELAAQIANLLEKNLVNEQTLRARGRVWVQDILDNAKYLSEAPCAHHLQGAFRGVPAFIVGAGPSLNKNIHLLEEAGQKGIVFAVNSSGRALDQAKVRPHVLACLESIDVSHLISDLSFVDEVVRLFSLTAHPNLFATGSGPLMSLFELLPHVAEPFRKFFGTSGLPVCGSVSTACFSLAYRLGCSPIVLVGQDLAYTDGRCYADGTPYEASRVEFDETSETLAHNWCETMLSTHGRASSPLLEGQRSKTTTAWGGVGQVGTATTFSQVQAWLERVGFMLKQSDGPQIINATEGGARISNFEEQRLADVLSALPERHLSPADIYQRALEKSPNLSISDVCTFLKAQQAGAETVARAARRLRSISEAAQRELSAGDPSVVAFRLNQLQEIEAEVKREVRAWPWVDAWAWRWVDEAMNEASEDGELSEVERGIAAEVRLGAAIENAATELAARIANKCAELVEQA